MYGTQRGTIKIKAEAVRFDQIQHIKIEIDNSKFELNKKENVRILKLTQLFEFKKILEAKVEINFKIAKILCNSLSWKIDFNAFRGSKYSMAFPYYSDDMADIGGYHEASERDNS